MTNSQPDHSESLPPAGAGLPGALCGSAEWASAFYVLLELIEDDHTFGILDTVIMASMCLLSLLIPLSYGA